jgi:hypothetical protein
LWLVAGGRQPGGLAVELEQSPARAGGEQLPDGGGEERSAHGLRDLDHDKDWQQHPAQNGAYSPLSASSRTGADQPGQRIRRIQSHKIVAARMYGNVLLVAVLINGRKSKALNLDYDPKTHTLNFSPPGVELYLGP